MSVRRRPLVRVAVSLGAIALGLVVARLLGFDAGGLLDNLRDTLTTIYVTDATTATAYSIGQQLAVTAWNIAFALVLVVWAFGWSRGKLLFGQAYDGASAIRRRGSGAQHQALGGVSGLALPKCPPT